MPRDSWFVEWDDLEGIPHDHDSFESARDDIVEEMTCRMRDIDIDEDIHDDFTAYYEAIKEVKRWKPEDVHSWVIEVADDTFSIDFEPE